MLLTNASTSRSELDKDLVKWDLTGLMKEFGVFHFFPSLSLKKR